MQDARLDGLFLVQSNKNVHNTNSYNPAIVIELKYDQVENFCTDLSEKAQAQTSLKREW